MPLQPIQRRSVPDEVFEQLAAEVVGGEIAPGDPLPSERRLAEVLGVSRPAVREALQRLGHAGLVEVRQGDATTVRDFRRHGGPELLPRLLVQHGELDPSVARSILEARLAIGPALAELAAARIDAEAVVRLRARVAELGSTTDPVALQRSALEFWEEVVDAADSIAFRLMFNSLRAAYEPALEALAPLMAEEVEQVDRYFALADALDAHDPVRARVEAEALLGPVTRSLIAALTLLESA